MKEFYFLLKDDYEVICFEFDEFVFVVWDYEGVIGLRMMGVGFGGCIISIVKDVFVDDFI